MTARFQWKTWWRLWSCVDRWFILVFATGGLILQLVACGGSDGDGSIGRAQQQLQVDFSVGADTDGDVSSNLPMRQQFSF
jgi:hypothetical protein